MLIDWMKHQEEANGYLDKAFADRAFAGLFMETGTGKTPVALRLAEEWIHSGLSPGLVICPNNLTWNWIDEITKWRVEIRARRFNEKNVVNPTTGRVVKTVNRLYLLGDDSWQLLIINYDATRGLKERLCQRGFRFAIYDELHRTKNRKALQSKACKAIGATCNFRLGLTGTPVTQSPLDLWSEFDVLGGQTSTKLHPLGYGSWSSYLRSVADVTPHPRLGLRVPIYSFPEFKIKELRKRVAPLVYQVTREDAGIKIPEDHQIRWSEMGAEQKRIYKEMREECVAILDEKLAETNLNAAISSVQLELSKIIKLQQITSGFIKADDGHIQRIPSCKHDDLREFLPELIPDNRKTCIFARFRHDIDSLREMLTDMEVPFVWVDGRNSTDVDTIVPKFRNDKGIKVFLGQIQVIKEGLNLIEANTVCFFSNAYNLEWREQAEGRIRRLGQMMDILYLDLCVRQTRDIKIVNRLKDKKDLATLTIGDLRRELLEEEDESDNRAA